MDELPDPVAGAGQVVVAVKACSINYPDVLIIEDKYQMKPPRPFAPGSEISGVVESVGEGVTDFKPGDRVLCTTGAGGLVEKIAVPAASLYALPAERSFEEGASLLLTYATSIHALLDRGHLKEGQTLLVLGAAGGVGLAAVELGKAFGARVVAAVSSEEKAQACRDAGADDVVIYGRAPFDKDQSKALADQFKAVLGAGGADVIYDPVSGDVFDESIRCIAFGGRLLVVGFTSGRIATVSVNMPLIKGFSLIGVRAGEYGRRNPQKGAENQEAIWRLANEGKLNPRVDKEYPLADWRAAFDSLAERRVIGKAVIRPDL